ncbi:MAG: hypothetical protein K2J65_11255 [Duncaniella sp.]|nr:hypothetical protein [Duncaniella sp.]
MYNVATKHLRHLGIALLTSAPVILNSCGNGDTQKAQALLSEARSAYENKDYETSLLLIDSIKNAFPREFDIRKEAIHLSTLSTEGLTIRQLETADSITAVLNALGDSLQRGIKFVSNPIEGYYVTKSVNPTSFIGSTGIQARMTPNGDFYIMSSLKAKPIKSTSVTVSANGKEARSATVSHDGERNDRSMGSEIITFMGVECDTIGKFIYENVNSPITLTFNGTGSYSRQLSSKEAEEIATLYEYATTIRKFKLASLEKERLTRALDLARSQAARTYVVKDSIK